MGYNMSGWGCMLYLLIKYIKHMTITYYICSMKKLLLILLIIPFFSNAQSGWDIWMNKIDAERLAKKLICNNKNDIVARFGIPDDKMITQRKGTKFISVYEYNKENKNTGEYLKMTFYFMENDHPDAYKHKDYQAVALVRLDHISGSSNISHTERRHDSKGRVLIRCP